MKTFRCTLTKVEVLDALAQYAYRKHDMYATGQVVCNLVASNETVTLEGGVEATNLLEVRLELLAAGNVEILRNQN